MTEHGVPALDHLFIAPTAEDAQNVRSVPALGTGQECERRSHLKGITTLPELRWLRVRTRLPNGRFCAESCELEIQRKLFDSMVPGGGLEPPRPCGLRILSPLRLPVSPSGPIAVSCEVRSTVLLRSYSLNLAQVSSFLMVVVARSQDALHPGFVLAVAIGALEICCLRSWLEICWLRS